MTQFSGGRAGIQAAPLPASWRPCLVPAYSQTARTAQ